LQVKRRRPLNRTVIRLEYSNPQIAMPAYRRYLTKLLADHTDAPYDDEKREFVEDIASALYERSDDLPPIEEWPQSVRYFYACYDLNYQVGNGGFAQAAYNVPELIPIALDAFRHFGHSNAVAHLERVITLLPSELADHDEKGFGNDETIGEVFEHFDESKLSELDEDIPDDFWVDARLQKLVEENRGEFASVDAMA